MMGYYAKWVWSNPQLTVRANPRRTQIDPQMTPMTQIFGCDDSHAEIAGRSRRGRGVRTAMSPAAGGREHETKYAE
jgi:hypothetical protein